MCRITGKFISPLLSLILLISIPSYCQKTIPDKNTTLLSSTGKKGLKSVDTMNSSRKMISFQLRVLRLYNDVNEKKRSKFELAYELSELMKNPLSKNNAFYDKIYNQIPKMLKQWNIDDYKFYIVKPGDCLWSIANMFKNRFLWHEILEANKGIISDPNLIFPQQKIKIPSTIFISFIDSTIARNQKETVKEKTKENISAEESGAKNNLPVKLNTIHNPDSLAQIQQNKNENLGVIGIIIDGTITKLGRDFYEVFYNSCQPLEDSQPFTIEVIEKPQPQIGTWITIKINDLAIYENIIQPRSDLIEEAAMEATDLCTSFMQDYEAILLEIQGEDLKGTGIY